MAIVEKTHGSRSADYDDYRRTYILSDYSTEYEAFAALVAAMPSSLNGRLLDTASITVTESTAPGYWEGEAVWTRRELEREPGQCSLSFDISVESVHISQSLETISSHAAAGDAPDYKGAINVTSEAVEGCDVLAASMTFDLTERYEAGDIDGSYIDVLYNLACKFNSGTFTIAGKAFAAGELLFLGATGGLSDEGTYEIVYRFASSPNVTGRQVGTMSGLAKKGWEYLWVSYQKFEDNDAKKLVERPAYAYVERVFDPGDFTSLLLCGSYGEGS